MVVRIAMDARTLAASRFAISPAVEVLGAVRGRGRHPVRHANRWYAAARARLEPKTLALLQALVPADHPYTPDFLHQVLLDPHERVDALVDRIAATPADLVDYHLDIAFRGRPLRPEVAATFSSPTAYAAWRRPLPPTLAALLERGPAAVAHEAAAALRAFYAVAVAADWPRVRSVLELDIAHRGEVMAGHGAATMLAELDGALSWTGSAVDLDRPFDDLVDWAEDGLLMVPSTVHVGPVKFSVERPLTPMIMYGSRGVATLWELPARSGTGPVRDLIGDTRATLLALLTDASTTRALGHRCGLSEATVSYHLGILHRSGLVSRGRHGRHVLYARTPHGDALLGGGSSSSAG